MDKLTKFTLKLGVGTIVLGLMTIGGYKLANRAHEREAAEIKR